ncbi:hypothetical protein SDC9_197776 [bioreactor metagenome]|uniref:Uncharacterized protein n=1 Tax=bioreactor metagenome TaxID=1076179 RepID=A0A645IGB1_9ZZZZ
MAGAGIGHGLLPGHHQHGRALEHPGGEGGEHVGGKDVFAAEAAAHLGFDGPDPPLVDAQHQSQAVLHGKHRLHGAHHHQPAPLVHIGKAAVGLELAVHLLGGVAFHLGHRVAALQGGLIVAVVLDDRLDLIALGHVIPFGVGSV